MNPMEFQPFPSLDDRPYLMWVEVYPFISKLFHAPQAQEEACLDKIIIQYRKKWQQQVVLAVSMFCGSHRQTQTTLLLKLA